MSDTPRIPLCEARRFAAAIAGALRPACEAVEVAGAVRRLRPDVGDLDLVCIPRQRTGFTLGDPYDTELDARLAELVRDGTLSPPLLDGDRQKRFRLPWAPPGGITLELYLTDAAGWGVVLAIRTGPREFARALVTERCRGGLLPDGYCVHERRVWRRHARDGRGEVVWVDGPVPTPDERDFLRICGGWVEPHRRGQQRASAAIAYSGGGGGAR